MIIKSNSPSKPNPTQKSITLNIKQTNKIKKQKFTPTHQKIKKQINKRKGVLPEQSHSHSQAALEQRYHDELHHYQTQVMKNTIKQQQVPKLQLN